MSMGACQFDIAVEGFGRKVIPGSATPVQRKLVAKPDDGRSRSPQGYPGKGVVAIPA